MKFRSVFLCPFFIELICFYVHPMATTVTITPSHRVSLDRDAKTDASSSCPLFQIYCELA